MILTMKQIVYRAIYRILNIQVAIADDTSTRLLLKQYLRTFKILYYCQKSPNSLHRHLTVKCWTTVFLERQWAELVVAVTGYYNSSVLCLHKADCRTSVCCKWTVKCKHLIQIPAKNTLLTAVLARSRGQRSSVTDWAATQITFSGWQKSLTCSTLNLSTKSITFEFTLQGCIADEITHIFASI